MRKVRKASVCLFVVLAMLVIAGQALGQHNKNTSHAAAPAPKPPSAPHQSAPPSHQSAPPSHQSAPSSHQQAPPSNAGHNQTGASQQGGHGSSGSNASAAGHGNNAGPTNSQASGSANGNHAMGGGNNNTHAGGTSNSSQGPGGNANRGTGAANNTAHGAGMTNNAHGAGAANNTGHGGAGNNAHGGATANNARGAAGPNGAHGPAGHGPNAAAGAGGHGTMANAHPGPHNFKQPTTTREIKTRSGQNVQASFRGGHVRTIQAHNMRIEHGLGNHRRVVMDHNGRRIVMVGRNRGFVQRAYFNRGGRAYVQRTYYVGGHPYAYAYRTYYYGGSPYYYYAPAYYYHPVYYGWAYNPWPQPAYYNWGWNASPWYGYYGPSYYQPYPAYPSASSWITDYSVADYLKAAYEARQNAKALAPFEFKKLPAVAALLSSDPLVSANLIGTGALTPGAWAGYFAGSGKEAAAQGMSPEVKQQITEELKMQLVAEKDAAANPNAAQGNADQSPALEPQHHIFIVMSNLTVASDSGDECELNSGDVLYRTGDAAGDDGKVDVTVKSAQKDDCPAGTNTAVELNDLQEMQNHLREEMDAGLKELAANQGKNGLPKAPDTATTAGEVPAPSADSNADKDLQQAEKDADQTENEVSQDASAAAPANNQ